MHLIIQYDQLGQKVLSRFKASKGLDYMYYNREEGRKRLATLLYETKHAKTDPSTAAIEYLFEHANVFFLKKSKPRATNLNQR